MSGFAACLFQIIHLADSAPGSLSGVRKCIICEINEKETEGTDMASDRSYYESVKERLIRYAQVDTQSINGTDAVPTTAKQFDLARMLRDELEEIGVQDVFLDEKCCVVYGKIPSNLSDLSNVPKEHTGRDIGFIAHMDTAPDASGSGVKPWVLENYDGGDIVLNKEKNIVMKASDYSNLKMYIGQDLILTDGTTLLGGDDKAGSSVEQEKEGCSWV